MSNATQPAPYVVRLEKKWTPEVVFPRLAGSAQRLWLDSARPDDSLGRYSFLMADPAEVIQAGPQQVDAALTRLATLQKDFKLPTIAGLPPFQGGAAGYFSYDLNRHFEVVPETRFNEFNLPLLSFGVYDVVLSWDHVQEEGWLISTGYPETDATQRHARAKQRAEAMLQVIHEGSGSCEASPTRVIPAEELAPCFACPEYPGVMSNFPQDDYLAAVGKSVEYIHAGDIFQVNLSQRLIMVARSAADALYLKLRQKNPAPFAGYYDFGMGQIVSASPERFIQVRDRKIESRPIKGTRRRSGRPQLDMYWGDELVRSEKDRSENVMIVDLLRNDLARICEDASVEVTSLCGLESYQTVQHLVSIIVGRLRQDVDVRDLLQATFPGGSITGAPKIRAMEIISELEPTARGPYCGSLGYIGFDGSIDWNILIRTIVAAGGWWQFPVGGGIVADSDPLREYEETWDKALGLLHAVLDE
ncbi:anthranilate synthase component I family protein [Blastopirellula marina]|uniref:Aminodeoxychorismate/anthranilate synthase component I n=1 Tax=Blastopirellula marina TaxID=124 RepID=A0A2S8GCY3_9BACT|nr:anthranilate synthase component I family protein [Blastopirellula marina]PQO41934.1 aminodeoxychorismate/anthranilate synthase component I [Blastopirellula marina]PTL46292.1 anthranilate synthase component I family protein [Blastopirellula marina]